MDPDRDMPLSLRVGMGSAVSITTLNTYRAVIGKDALGGALNVDAQYNKQSARFVSTLPSM